MQAMPVPSVPAVPTAVPPPVPVPPVPTAAPTVPDGVLPARPDYYACRTPDVISFPPVPRPNGKPYTAGIIVDVPAYMGTKTMADGSTRRYISDPGTFLVLFTTAEFAHNVLGWRDGNPLAWISAGAFHRNVHTVDFTDVHAALAFGKASGMK